jgi:hypothetical protein
LESDTAKLEEAVTADREALKERTRERVPIDWGGTQNNLGNALEALGERESDTARARRRPSPPFAGLRREYPTARAARLGRVQYHLGNAVATLGERESNTTVESHRRLREALKTRERGRSLGRDAEQSGRFARHAWGEGERHGEARRAVAAYRDTRHPYSRRK